MLFLAPEIRACRERDTIVFLDLRRDRYFSISAARAPAILGVYEEGSGAAREQLLAMGLVAEEGEAAAEPPPVKPHASLLPIETDAHADLSALATFWAACTSASIALARKRLDRTLASLARAKGRPRSEASSDVRTTVALFESLRPWFPRDRVCLFDSLALMRFLLARGNSADLVMGVRTGPFSAHCWVETEGVVLSDTLEQCVSFTPIACV